MANIEIFQGTYKFSNLIILIQLIRDKQFSPLLVSLYLLRYLFYVESETCSDIFWLKSPTKHFEFTLQPKSVERRVVFVFHHKKAD